MTLESELLERINSGECQSLELKKSLSLRKAGLQGLCAMVNTDGAAGTVVFGVEPDGKLCGIDSGDRDSMQQSTAQAIRTGFQPALIADIQVHESEGKWVMVVSATRDSSVPYHEYDGRAWIREGSTNRQLTLAEKAQLKAARDELSHPGPWVCDSCGTVVGQVSGVVRSDDGVSRVIPPCHCGGKLRPAS